MTDEQIRIAIAEACGWRQLPKAVRVKVDLGYDNYFWADPQGMPEKEPPDFPNDLNAMHEAEGCTLLTGRAYLDWLAIVVAKEQRPQWWHSRADIVEKMVHATTRQRAEAFLRTIGKWSDV